MSCPNWSTLIMHRDQNEEGELQWGHALPHLDTCEACREEALALEPTLVFRRLPTVEANSRQIDDMKLAVAAMRRAQPFIEAQPCIEAQLIVEADRTKPARKRFTTLRLAAAVAVMTGSGLLYGLLAPELDPSVSTTLADVPSAASFEQVSAEAESLPAANQGQLQIEIHVLTGSTVDRGAPMLKRSPSAELVEKLKEVVDYEVFEVIAQGDVTSSEGDMVATKLGRDFKASFKTGEMSAEGAVLLRDFEMEKISVIKGRQAPAKMFHYSELELSLENPMTLVVAPADPNRPALILTITCRWEPTGSAH